MHRVQSKHRDGLGQPLVGGLITHDAGLQDVPFAVQHQVDNALKRGRVVVVKD